METADKDTAVAPTEQHRTVWRCATCGKWSFAKRRPKQHYRTIVLEAASSCSAPCGNCGGGCGGASPAITVTVQCGPFAAWSAVLQEPDLAPTTPVEVPSDMSPGSPVADDTNTFF